MPSIPHAFQFFGGRPFFVNVYERPATISTRASLKCGNFPGVAHFDRYTAERMASKSQPRRLLYRLRVIPKRPSKD